MEFARSDGSTLVVVTSDHDTGGLAVLDRDNGDSKFKPEWISGSHTGNMVALYAFGLGAEKLMGTHGNTDIPKVFGSLWGRALGE